jgi:hypothetical protein
VWGVLALVFLAGSRHLLTRGVPSVGELVPFTTGPVDLLKTWASGWHTAGLGSDSPNPTLFGAVGLLGMAFVGAMGLLRTVLTLGLLPLGALGAYRLARPIGSRYAQTAALLVYVANPLPYDALASGRWGALALYATAPTLVGLLARAGRLAPFGPVGGRAWPLLRGRTTAQLVLAVGVLTAVVACVLPSVVLIVPGVAIALALGSLLVYQARGIWRMVAVALGGSGLAVLLHLPWSFAFLLPGTTVSSLTGLQVPDRGANLATLLRFQVGPLGGAPLGYALLVAAALPLLIGQGQRRAWAVRGWTLALASWAAAWGSQQAALPFTLPPPEVLLVPAAVGLALAAAMGVAAFEEDLPGYRFGWRQIASGLAAAAVALACLPVLGAAFDGRWSMPAGDHARALGFVDDENDASAFRVLWVGDPTALPLAGWQLGDGLAYATTDGGTPRLEDLLVGSDDGTTGLLADAIELAQTGQTARLGRLLAPMAIRYVVLPERLAPAPFGTQRRAAPPGFKATLDAQLDLQPLDVPAGLTVYRNEAFAPMRGSLALADAPPTAGGIAAAAGLDLSHAKAALPSSGGVLRWTGTLSDDSYLYLSEASSDRWQLSVAGHTVEPEKPFGWAMGFPVTTGGKATLHYRTTPFRYVMLLTEVLAWLFALRALIRIRLSPSSEPVGSA